MAKITYNPAVGGAILVENLEGQSFTMENIGGTLLPVVDDDLRERYLIVLPGDPELHRGLYQLVPEADALMDECDEMFDADEDPD